MRYRDDQVLPAIEVWVQRITGEMVYGDQTEELLPAKPLEQDGNRISGSLSLEQSWPEGATGTVDVSFDLAYTDEIQDCSL